MQLIIQYMAGVCHAVAITACERTGKRSKVWPTESPLYNT